MNPLRLDSPPRKALDLPRNEMAFRERYRDLLLARTLTTVFRPGHRIYPSWRGYMEGEVVDARVIRRPGSDEQGVPPLFHDFGIPIRITSLTLRHVEALEAADFAGSSPDVSDRRSLLAHLADIYERPIEFYGNRVTRIGFVYVG